MAVFVLFWCLLHPGARCRLEEPTLEEFLGMLGMIERAPEPALNKPCKFQGWHLSILPLPLLLLRLLHRNSLNQTNSGAHSNSSLSIPTRGSKT